MSSGKPRVPSKARAVPVGAAVVCRGNMAAACEMTRPSKVTAAAAHMPARSVAAAHGVASPSGRVTAATATAVLRQCRSCARQNQS
jgi:hypothetical protein